MNIKRIWESVNMRVAVLLFLLAGCSQKSELARDGEHGGEHKLEAVGGAQPAPGKKACAEHGLAEDECGICHPERAAGLMPGEALKVRLPAADSAAIVGVETDRARAGTITESVECYAELAFNQNKLAQIAAPVGGIVQEVEVDLGSKVAEKQTVAKIWSAALAEAMARAVLTHQTLEREQKLRGERVTSARDLEEAEAAHRAACQQARTLGFSEEDIERLRERPDEAVMLEVRAPFAGEIVERSAVQGALVESGKSLFTLTDRSTMWAMLKIPETALARVKTGQAVELQVESLPGRTFTGKLTWLGAEVGERTRMAQARVEVLNPEGLLRARMFAKARILVRMAQGVVLVPDTALCSVGGKPFLFVKAADDLFEVRAVNLGTRFNGQIEVLQGLKAEEVVVVNHGFSIKSQWLSSRMGAGCAD
jgi:cobalt-zinc-cadmium efflux system membrane fusion protein